MKKTFLLLTLFLISLFLFLNSNDIGANQIDVEKSIFVTKSGPSHSVGCNEDYCGVIISPCPQSSSYSFLIENESNLSKYHQPGQYKLDFWVDLIHEYSSMEINIISKVETKSVAINSQNFSITKHIYSEYPFFLEFNYHVSSISYVNDEVDVDLFKNFNFKNVSSHPKLESLILETGSLWNHEEDFNNFVVSPNDLTYSFKYQKKGDYSFFKAGEYYFSFVYELNSCQNMCKDFKFQKISIITNTNSETFNVSYLNEGIFEFNFVSEEDFYLKFENKVNSLNSTDFPIDNFSNPFLKKSNIFKPFPQITNTGSLYNADTEENFVALTPNMENENLYRFILSKNSFSDRFASGIYNLEFNYSLDSYDQDEGEYIYQEISLISFFETKTFNVNYKGEGNKSFNFSFSKPFYIEIENKINLINNETMPIDVFSDFKLTKTSELEDDSPPEFDENIGVYVSEVDDPVSVEKIKEELSAYDETDGDVSQNIFLEQDNYSDNKDTLGEYSVVFGVYDNSYNYSYIEIIVNVMDFTPPNIEQTKQISCFISKGCLIEGKEPFNIEKIEDVVKIIDNYDVDLKPKIKEDNWSEHEDKNINNNYYIKVYAKDTSLNKSNIIKIELNYFDDIIPYIYSGTYFKKGQTYDITLQYILKQIKISNNFSGYNTLQTKSAYKEAQVIQDNYSENKHNLGIHTIKLKIANQTFNIKIEVIDNKAPLFEIGSKIIHLDDFKELNKEELIDLLIQLNILEKDYYNFDYSKETLSETQKRVIISFKNIDNIETKKEIIFKNLDIDSKTDETRELDDSSEETSFFRSLLKTLSNFLSNILNFIKNIFVYHFITPLQ